MANELPPLNRTMQDFPNLPPFYDEAQQAWVLSTYADVSAAMRDPALFLSSNRIKPLETRPDPIAHKAMRDETREAVAAPYLEIWRTQLQSLAGELADGFDISHPIDLLGEFADPICLQAASIITGVPAEEATRLRAHTEPISNTAANPLDTELRAASKAAQVEVAKCFHARIEQFREPGFVALTHTMPRLIGRMWMALVEHPTQWAVLHADPSLTPLAIEELLRFAGLAVTIHRRAAEDTTINGLAIQKNERVVLRLAAANHDPEHFSRGTELDIERRESGHLSLGAGQHSCVGAPLIRMITQLCTRALVERFSSATLSEPVELKGGVGFRYLAALRVMLSHD